MDFFGAGFNGFPFLLLLLCLCGNGGGFCDNTGGCDGGLGGFGGIWPLLLLLLCTCQGGSGCSPKC